MKTNYHPTRETDLAFIEDLEFMLSTGESKAIAAARLGTNLAALEARIARGKKRLADGSKQDVREAA